MASLGFYRGFNRLAWLFPYLAAAAALSGIIVTARPAGPARAHPPPPGTPVSIRR